MYRQTHVSRYQLPLQTDLQKCAYHCFLSVHSLQITKQTKQIVQTLVVEVEMLFTQKPTLGEV